MTINKENMRLWVAALRSGEYKQGTGTLERTVDGETRHCCLGVACRVAMNNGLKFNIIERRPSVINSSTSDTFFDGEVGVLPEPVRKWLGLDSSNPIIAEVNSNYIVSATFANDT